MIRVLFVARYRDDTMYRKLELLAAEPDLQLWHICPRDWRDEHFSLRVASGVFSGVTRTALGLFGAAADPHRSVYRTLTFGLRSIRPHIIHAEEEPESLAAVQIAIARGLFAPGALLALNTWQNQPRAARWYVHAVRRSALGASTAVFCASTEAADLLRQGGYRRPTPVLPAIGVDSRVFKPAAGPRAASTFIIGYAGRLAAEKGLDTLIEAVRQLAPEAPPGVPPVELRLIGSGPQRAALEQQAQAAGVRKHVQFIPSLRPTELAAALQELDILVLPSRPTPTWKEQFGRVLTEAMACEVAVVGSRTGAIPEVIGDAGLLFEAGDADDLAARLRQLRDAPGHRQALAAAGLARVRAHFTQERIAAQTAALYRQWLAPLSNSHAHHA